MVKTRSSDRKSQQKTDRPSASYQRNARSPQVDKRVRNETPKTSIGSRRRKSNNEWNYIISQDLWFPGKITTNVTKNVLTNFKSKFTDEQKVILADTCFSFYMDCQEVVLQPQLIHYFLLREVKQPNPNEMWFKVANKYVRFLLSEFCVVKGMRCNGKDVRKNLEHIPSRINGTYFESLKLVTNEECAMYS